MSLGSLGDVAGPRERSPWRRAGYYMQDVSALSDDPVVVSDVRGSTVLLCAGAVVAWLYIFKKKWR